MTVTKQSAASIIRQVLAIAAIVVAAISTSANSIHLPPIGSAILGLAGTIIIGIEHYVGDPSTGTPTTPAPAPTHATIPATFAAPPQNV
jgi:hypothetical protein